MTPRIKDDDRDQITAEINGQEIRGWSYADRNEQRIKMLMAREFAEGWHQAMKAVEARSERRTREMIAELPADEREALELKGAI